MKTFITSLCGAAALVAAVMVPQVAVAEGSATALEIGSFYNGASLCAVDRANDVSTCCATRTHDLTIRYIFRGVMSDSARASIDYAASCSPKEQER